MVRDAYGHRIKVKSRLYRLIHNPIKANISSIVDLLLEDNIEFPSAMSDNPIVDAIMSSYLQCTFNKAFIEVIVDTVKNGTAFTDPADKKRYLVKKLEGQEPLLRAYGFTMYDGNEEKANTLYKKLMVSCIMEDIRKRGLI